MAPLPDALLSLLPRALFALDSHPTINVDPRSLSPMAVHDVHLAKRVEPLRNPGAGSRPANTFNNKGFQALFALIGAGMVLTAIWFFFWAKNGGFKFQQGDWDDYKTTVMRRKGPDGKTLSNATKSTKLGGGSVVHGGSYGAESVGYTDETGTSYGEMREVEEGKGRKFGLRGGEAKKKARRDHTNDWKDPELRDYRHEKPARVGGLNRQADGVYTDYSVTNPSDLGSNVSSKPLVAKEKDKKKLAKEKEARARERMRQAKLAEKAAAKNAAAEVKAKKAAEKEQAKKNKEAEKKTKKEKKKTMTEATPTEADITEYAMSEAAPAIPKTQSRRAPPSAAYSFTTGDDTNTVYTGAYTDNRTAPSEAQESSYYSDYRPNADPSAFPNNRSRRDHRSEPRSRHSSASPRKQHRSSRPSAAPSDIFTQANGNVQGTISYPCHIPGLSSAGSVGVSESVSQAGGPSARRGRDVMDGYRRGGVRTVGRRDSLSDSDG
ncbi:hypothetical protein BDV96DRAFT_577540 [Lophiotrema nucula]|uniref:Uncharacterized protein n=1 Tax=Lophiotrema nucula TaxID=690887 RepID=A0A6A5Z505_9PLEO|nr:hypothetical protein BDV96DRAFT_577540 [Lophiotrema nucula]